MEKTATQIEQERLSKHLFRRFHQACQQYGLLADGDKVLIGLSGGKDSLLLTELLGRQARIFVPRIEVTAVHIRVRERNYQSDLTYLESFCREAGVPFMVRDTEIANPTADDRTALADRSRLAEIRTLTTNDQRQKTKDPCFVCAWYRRKALLELAQELGCNRIALGHHRDDILHTLLMNLTFQGSFATMPPLLKLDKMPLAHIRPLCLIDEKDIVRYAELRGYQKQMRLCPFEHASSRTEVRQLFAELEKLNPDIRSSLWNAMHNVKNDYLPRQIAQ